MCVFKRDRKRENTKGVCLRDRKRKKEREGVCVLERETDRESE